VELDEEQVGDKGNAVVGQQQQAVVLAVPGPQGKQLYVTPPAVEDQVAFECPGRRAQLDLVVRFGDSPVVAGPVSQVG
jgi:hypothetical protein